MIGAESGLSLGKPDAAVGPPLAWQVVNPMRTISAQSSASGRSDGSDGQARGGSTTVSLRS